MPRAIWNNKVIAESDHCIEIEGNQYFPPDAVNSEFLRESDHHTWCPWKGEASYYHVVVGDKENSNAAWYYPNPKEAAKEIKNYLAFWHGVQVEK